MLALGLALSFETGWLARHHHLPLAVICILPSSFIKPLAVVVEPRFRFSHVPAGVSSVSSGFLPVSRSMLVGGLPLGLNKGLDVECALTFIKINECK